MKHLILCRQDRNSVFKVFLAVSSRKQKITDQCM